MKCPVCGLIGSDYFHVAGHVLSYERLHGRGLRGGAGGPPVAFPTFRETATMVGAAMECGLTRFKDGRLVIPD